jgi:CheY-like chemotaxis protein
MGSENILIVEDDAVVIKILESQFRTAGYKVVAAHSSAEAIRSTVTQRPDLMILDLTLIDGVSVNGIIDGLSLLEWLRRTLPEARFPVIIHTADTSNDLEQRASPYGVKAVFRKGRPIKELMDAVRQALDERKAADEPKAA